MAKFFRFPFALNGDRAAIPDDAQSDGSVSFNQGFGPFYELPLTDPNSKRVPRDETNQYIFDITDNIRQYQLNGTPDWVTAAQNGGAPVAYSYGARVRYDAGAGVRVWQSTTVNNTSTPGTDANWVLSEPFNFAANVATNAEVQAGTANDKIITPLNLRALTATTGRPGIAVIASPAEVIAGTVLDKTVTPAGLSARTATETTTGLVQLATPTEVADGSNSAKVITPASLLSRVATAAARGLAALASQAEVIAGTVNDKIVTPATLNGRTATVDRTGIVELATVAEAQAGVDQERAVTPQGLAAALPWGSSYVWTDLTSSRSVGTAYTNTTGKPLQLSVNTGANSRFQVMESGVWVEIAASGATSICINAIIKAGQQYRMSASGAGWTWFEFRG